jgi:hypothetical protein
LFAGRLQHATQEALLALAAARAVAGLPLTLDVFGAGLSTERVANINNMVEHLRAGVVVVQLERGSQEESDDDDRFYGSDDESWAV